MLRFLTAGESHGMALTAIIEGLPAGLKIKEGEINSFLERRQKSHGRGTRMKKIEKDKVTIVGGIRNGVTIGSPVALHIENKDWAIRKDKKSYKKKVPRPGHADLAGAIKYGFDDIQNVIERSSARETAARTAVGAIAKILLAEFGIDLIGHVTGIGDVVTHGAKLTLSQIKERVSDSPVYCADPECSELMCAEIDKAKANGDTLGGVFEVQVLNAPPGLGSYVHWDRKLDGMLGQIILSIPSVKAVEIGDGISNAAHHGTDVHDQLFMKGGRISRQTNRAGGLEGGVSNGEIIVVRGYAKPISSLRNPLKSVDLQTGKATNAPYVRSDVCVVPAISVIAEAMVSWVIAQCFVEKFGGDSIQEMRQNFRGYMDKADES